MNDSSKLPPAMPHGSHPLHGERRRATDEPARGRSKEGWDAGWMNRNNSTPAAPGKPAGRHSAITRNLYSWTSYKTWADRVKNNWDEPNTKK